MKTLKTNFTIDSRLEQSRWIPKRQGWNGQHRMWRHHGMIWTRKYERKWWEICKHMYQKASQFKQPSEILNAIEVCLPFKRIFSIQESNPRVDHLLNRTSIINNKVVYNNRQTYRNIQWNSIYSSSCPIIVSFSILTARITID
ncbi:unnamed protein product [Schistosoma margrebowiei]|uniref:Uncharacterized protein n=1 Tax=Schistosoma margrebowiei TaxID=48269 RepID=A0A183N494_9TREM|nr:unnamed protein product [Schistosoma margrebowiei]